MSYPITDQDRDHPQPADVTLAEDIVGYAFAPTANH
jgi:hypothetical protein